MATRILEASENLKGETMLTVRTLRGHEYVINQEQAILALADLLSEYDNEKHFGWDLQGPWYEQEIAKLRRRVVP